MATSHEYDEIAKATSVEGLSRDALERRVDAGINRAVAPEKPKPEAETEAEAFVPERHTFDFNWTNGAGRRYVGRFTCRVASVRDHIQIGVKAADWRGGIPPEMLDEMTNAMCEALATVQQVVEPAEGAVLPDWFKNMAELSDADVVNVLYGEVQAHWARFRQRGRASS